MPDDKPPDDKFTDLLTKLVRVPKAEIDEREREYQQTKTSPQRTKPVRIVENERPK
jgi:hypothetical protein